jgi:hypothetical protein
MNRTSSLVRYAPPLLFSIVLAQACTSAVADPGGTASEVRATGAFRGIEIAGTIEVEARIAPATRVEVIGEPDRVKQVITSVAGGVLKIDTKGKTGRSRLRVVVTALALETFSISGTGELRATGLDGGTIEASIGGTGAMQLAGKAQALRLSVPGTGEVRAKDLVVADATLDVAGTAEAKLYATRSVDARIGGTGAIRVHGRPPTVKKSITGTGIVDVD